MNFSEKENQFYSRQMRLPEVGPEGQARLKGASVLLVGLGGLGSPVALYLAAAGVGRLGIVEFDRVDASNLHRQILYGHSDVGQLKVERGIARLKELNPFIQVEAHPFRFSAGNARELVRRYDLVTDGADNFSTRYLVNDACVLEGRSLVSASILGFEGQLSVFNHRGGPCYRCLYEQPPAPETVPSCAEAGVLGVLPGIMGTLQANEVLKLLLGIGDPAVGRLLHFDALALRFSEFKLHRSEDCPVCGETPTIREVVDGVEACETAGFSVDEISPAELKARIQAGIADFVLVDVRELFEREICAISPSEHYPLASVLDDRVDLPKDKTVIVYCKMGGRSLRAAQHLVKRGQSRVLNLTGGILAWADQVDPGIRKY